MHPVIVKFGPLTIYSYGLMIAIAYLLGIYIARKDAARRDIKPELVYDLALYLVIGLSVVNANDIDPLRKDVQNRIDESAKLIETGSLYSAKQALSLLDSQMVMERDQSSEDHLNIPRIWTVIRS